MPGITREEAAAKEDARQAAMRDGRKPIRYRLDECVVSADAARDLGVSRQAVRNMVHDGFIKGFRIGNTVLVPKDEVERVREYVPRKRGRHRKVAIPPNIVDATEFLAEG